MNWLGFMFEWVYIVWQQLWVISNVGEMMLMLYFVEVENLQGIVELMCCIEQVVEGLDCLCLLVNLVVIFWYLEVYFDWVCSGIVLYGVLFFGQWQDIVNIGLKLVMMLCSEIIGVQNLCFGEVIGYGGLYCIIQEQWIGIVVCGYVDGYLWVVLSGMLVLVDGVCIIIVGCVLMDMLVVDLMFCLQVGIGVLVELWGKEIKIDDVVVSSGIVGYELMCVLVLWVLVVIL